MRRSSIVSRIKKVLKYVVPGLTVILYGSEVRGEARAESDIDLLLLLDKDVVTLADKMALTAPLYELELQTGIQINPFILSVREWGKQVTPFYENVMKDAIVL